MERLTGRPAKVAVVAVLFVATGMLLAPTTLDMIHAETTTISGGYIFEADVPELVAGYSDNVFVGRVVDKVGQSPPMSQFLVEIETAYKGSLAGTLVVEQSGWVEGNDTYLPQDQAVLEAGGRYVFMSRDAEVPRADQTVVAGPHGVRELNSDSATSILEATERAVQGQQWPDSVERE